MLRFAQVMHQRDLRLVLRSAAILCGCFHGGLFLPAVEGCEPVSAGARLIAERHMSSIFLIQDPVVQADLAIEASQQAALRRLTAEFARPTERADPPMGSTQEERMKLETDRKDAYSERVRHEILSGKQRERMEQIQNQLLGMWFFLHEECRRTLKIDDRQQLPAILKIHSELTQRGDELVQRFRTAAAQENDAGKRAALAQALGRDLDAMELEGVRRVVAGLTEAQQKAFAAMTGRQTAFTRSQLKLTIRTPVGVSP